jgi:hypothetical protein
MDQGQRHQSAGPGEQQHRQALQAPAKRQGQGRQRHHPDLTKRGRHADDLAPLAIGQPQQLRHDLGMDLDAVGLSIANNPVRGYGKEILHTLRSGTDDDHLSLEVLCPGTALDHIGDAEAAEAADLVTVVNQQLVAAGIDILVWPFATSDRTNGARPQTDARGVAHALRLDPLRFQGRKCQAQAEGNLGPVTVLGKQQCAPCHAIVIDRNVGKSDLAGAADALRPFDGGLPARRQF